MTALTETQRGVLLSRMSDASCAMTLGRSARWVAARRAELASPATEEILAPPNAAPSRGRSETEAAAARPPTPRGGLHPDARRPTPDARRPECVR